MNLVDFLAKNYLWFLIITLVLVFALIGYIAEDKKKKEALLKKDEPKEKTNEEKTKEEISKMGDVTLDQAIKKEEIKPNKKSKDKEKEKEPESVVLQEYDAPLIVEEDKEKDKK